MKRHIPINEHSKGFIKAQKIREYKDRIKSEKEEQKKSIETICREMELLIKDTRYKGYKYLLTSMLNEITQKRNNLRNSMKTNDEYLRNALICDAEIGILRKILEMPKDFAEQLKELKLSKEKSND